MARVLELNTLGDTPSRDAYRAALVALFRRPPRRACPTDSQDPAGAQPAPHPRQQGRGRPQAGRRRADHRRPSDRRGAPPSTTALKAHLARFGVPFRENPRIVRGLDYYSHTAFEFVTDQLGAQGTVMGGGRYDGLMQQMGGPPIPARRLGRRDRAAGDAAGRPRRALPAPVAVVPLGGAAEEAAAIDALQALRRAGIRGRDGLSRQRQAPHGARQPHRRPRRRHHRRGRARPRRGADEGPRQRRAGRGAARRSSRRGCGERQPRQQARPDRRPRRRAARAC